MTSSTLSHMPTVLRQSNPPAAPAAEDLPPATLGLAAQISMLSAEFSRPEAGEAETLSPRQRILNLALSGSPAAQAATLCRRTGGELSHSCSVGVDAAWLDELQARTAQGPAVDAFELEMITVVSDWSAETRWPGLVASVTARSGLASAVCIPLSSGGHPDYCLNLYSEQRGAFDGRMLHGATLAGACTALGLTAIESLEKAGNLSQALDSNRRIGAAIGVLMSTLHCTEDEAFTLLRRTSQHRHIKLREVAEDVLYTGALPPVPAAGKKEEASYDVG